MAKGTINGTTSNQYIISKIEWTAQADEKNNTSLVTAKLYYKRTNTGYATVGEGSFNITIGTKTSYTSSKDMEIRTEWVLAMSWSQTVEHNIDGTKSVTISASGYIPGTTLEYTNCSETVDLDTISRPTVIQGLTCSTGFLTGTLSYNYRPLSDYYSKANVSLNINGTYIHIRSILHGKKTRGETLTHNFQFTASELSLIYNNLPNDIGGKIRVTMRTYSDSSYSYQHGDAYHNEIYLDIPINIVPTANLSLQLDNENNAWIKKQKICVAGHSGIQLSLTGDAGEGALILSRSIRGGGYSSDSDSLHIDKILNHGKITFTGSIANSRGQTETDSKSINVEPYSIPAIRDLMVTRGTYSSEESLWTPDDNGPDVGVFFKASLALTNYNNAYGVTFTWDGVEKTPNYGNQESLVSGTEYAFYFVGVDGEKSYALRVLATDLVGESGAATITVPTTFITMEFNSSGKGIAFGKTSEKDAFECAMDAVFTGDVIIGGYKIVFNDDGTCSWQKVT